MQGAPRRSVISLDSMQAWTKRNAGIRSNSLSVVAGRTLLLSRCRSSYNCVRWATFTYFRWVTIAAFRLCAASCAATSCLSCAFKRISSGAWGHVCVLCAASPHIQQCCKHRLPHDPLLCLGFRPRRGRVTGGVATSPLASSATSWCASSTWMSFSFLTSGWRVS